MMRWVTNQQQSEYMRLRQRQNLERSKSNDNENAAARIIASISILKWKRQALWGCRIFDFWCHTKGAVIEIDGPEHDLEYDLARDEYNALRSAIIVIRIKNGDWDYLVSALSHLDTIPDWSERRTALGVNARGRGSKKLRRAAITAAGIQVAHGEWEPPTLNVRPKKGKP